MTDFTQATATKLSELYRSGAVSPVTVAEQVLVKIKRVNPLVNAFCFIDPETTLKQAHASEQRWQQGQSLSAIDGIPVAVKDSILTKGWPTLHGSLAIDPNQPWLEDDPTVARLRKDGAVLLGKTTAPEFNLRVDTYSEKNGITRNPWNLDYSPGGSSGGSAAAVAAGLGPISIGSDQGGSIILPSAFSGVVGFKPTGNTVIGHMAQTVNDIELVTQIQKLTVDLKNLNIFYFRDSYYNEIVSYTDTAVELLKSQGFKIQQLELKTNLTKLFSMFMHNIQQPDQSSVNASIISKNVRHILDKIQHCDIIITSSANVTACRANTLPPSFYLNKKYKNTCLYRSNSFLWNMTGQPAITIPTGQADNGLPVGLQIVGRVNQDNLVLQFAKSIEFLFPKLHSPFFKGDQNDGQILHLGW
jgi:aspartyl-tRNA(Asn)/glutamyl-tRNA(Gln) amidotransferase subunit A